MKKSSERIFKTLISLLCLCALLCPALCGCKGSGAPAIDEVRDTFTKLINDAAEINDIFFGQGLPVYDRKTSTGDGNASYDEESKTYYWTIEDSKLGTVIKVFNNETKKNIYFTDGKPSDSSVAIIGDPIRHAAGDGTEHTYYQIDYKDDNRVFVYDSSSPAYYDFVLLDCKYQTVDSIKKAARKVYSEKYLTSVYGVIFDGFMTDDTVVYARYMEDSTVEDGMYFLKSNRFEPYFETQTTYDCSTMKIISPSSAKRVIIEIEATGRYIDYDNLEVVTGTYKKTLTFVFEDDDWKLDTPTY